MSVLRGRERGPASLSGGINRGVPHPDPKRAMDAMRGSPPEDDRVLELIAAHCRSLDPDTPPARERLEAALGVELTHMLLYALAPHPRERAA